MRPMKPKVLPLVGIPIVRPPARLGIPIPGSERVSVQYNTLGCSIQYSGVLEISTCHTDYGIPAVLYGCLTVFIIFIQ